MNSSNTPMIFMSNSSPYYGSLLTLCALEVDISKIVSFINNHSNPQQSQKYGLQVYVLYGVDIFNSENIKGWNVVKQ